MAAARIGLDKCVTDLNNNFSQEDLHEINETAHTLKGLALSVCFDELATLAHQLEEMAIFKEDKIKDIINKIELEVQQVKILIT